MKSLKMRKPLLLPFSLLPLAFAANAADLPAGYMELESISSTGAQYIDTGYTHKANTKIVCEVSVASEQPGTWAGVFGARKNSFQSNAFCFFAKCDDDVNKACYNRSGNEMRSESAFPKGVKTTLTCESANATWTAEDGTGGSIMTTGKCDDGYNTMFVFNLNTAGRGGRKADTSPCVMTLYSFRIYEGETLVREFVPCVRDFDGAIGLYDLAAAESDKVFYANSGTGTFGLPAEVRCTVTIGDYPHLTAAYTYGDGAVTNGISGNSFEILKGRTGVKVIFTAMRNHKIVDGKSVVELEGAVTDDLVFGEGNDYAVPTAACSLDEVPYLDWDDVEKKVTNATLNVEYETVSSATREFKDGHWYVVTNAVEIADGSNIRVNGSARLILADNASLTIKNVGKDKAAIDVAAGRVLTIYGQKVGSGALTATGGNCGAGIGGGTMAHGGKVTIHGGTVTANGGLYSAGIGGGYTRGAGGEVTITGGRVTARGFSYPGVDDIGHALGDDYGNDSGTVSISGGLFGMDVYISWLAENYWVTDNDDVETKGGYPHKVVYAPDKWQTVRFDKGPNITGVKVRYYGRETFVDFPADGVRLPIGLQFDVRVETASGYYYGGETAFVVTEGGINRSIEATERLELPYLDWDPATSRMVERTCSDYTVVDRYCNAFTNGGWYAVMGDVEISGNSVKVDGSAHLILCDNTSLKVGDVGERDAAIAVAAGKALTIYGQKDGSGSLTVNGGKYGAGIGGGYGAVNASGTVTINGGTVTATGGSYGAGIGGGDGGACGTVTINGGTVTATGGLHGAGIGGGNGAEVSAVILGENAVVVKGAVGNGSSYVMICDAGDYDCPAVTVGALTHMTAVWTSGNGAVKNLFNGARFRLLKGTEGVKVIFTAAPGYSFDDGVITAEVVVGRVDANCEVTVPEVRMSEIESFGRGWYVTAPRGAYVDTLFKPDSNTRVEMDVNVGRTTRQEYWFGCWDGNWDDRAFALGNDAKNEVYCGYGSGAGTHCGGITGVIPSGRVTVALEKGVVYTNGVVWSAAHESDATFALNHNLYLFAQNRAGTMKPGDIQERIVCYGCKISTNDVNGAAVPVRNFVPARTKDARQAVGLCDMVSGEFFAPHGGTLTLGYDGPTCEGGTIEWCDAANAWVVTPDEGVTEVTIAGLPTGATVAVPPTVRQVGGVADAQIVVRSRDYNITGAFAITGGAIALNENGVVTIDEKEIPVKPTIGDLSGDATEAFAVGEGCVTVTVRAIPGLKYTLLRGESVESVTAPAMQDVSGMFVAQEIATATTVTLPDDEPPQERAFYRVMAAVP